jgi:DNA recombination protein RmuC
VPLLFETQTGRMYDALDSINSIREANGKTGGQGMLESMTIVVLGLLVTGVILQIFLFVRWPRADKGAVEHRFDFLEKLIARTEGAVREEMAGNRAESAAQAKQSRDDLAHSLNVMGDALHRESLDFTRTTDQKLGAMRDTIDLRLGALVAENIRQLDQIRATVDEKLQGTLERRLGESFKQVSERLEQVYKGLGEMQVLATGVGDLKRVLTNVKSRGTWGEVQLGAMLDQVLTPEQFSRNVATKDGGERVEYAVRLPGKGDDHDEIVWLPIDAKFPTEDYQRLTEAQEKADPESAESAAKELENRIKQCASDICRKYINAPRTTDFGILFLPTEGLFSEVIRRTGLVDYVQRECRVVIAGPTTLWSILNSLQLGFRTLAIEKRSSEVWNLLAAVKTEWMKYGEILEKVKKKLGEASDTIEKAQTRTRIIGRKLKDVQGLPAERGREIPAIESGIEDPTAAEVDEDLRF